jgi:hypothetical protein
LVGAIITEVFRNQLRGQLAGRAHASQNSENADVGDQNARDAQAHGALDVFHGINELIGAARAQSQSLAALRIDLRTDVERAARADEKIDFDLVPAAELDHLENLVVGQQHDAAALADAVNRHGPLGGLGQHGLERPRPFRARDLDAVLRAVRKAFLRGRQIRRVLRRPALLLEKLAGFGHRNFNPSRSMFGNQT